VLMIVSLGLPLTASDWAIGGVAAVALVLARFVAKLAGTTALGSFSGPLTAGWLHSEYGHWAAALIHPLYLLAGSVLLAWV
ncbi:hypothetical protein WL388_12145, partial [Staphylococcus epidermidis]|uniref:hypothetical protein n=1 Tax=Staphylococcus epidermidis TaxID=1282 RepID=UPI0030C46097